MKIAARILVFLIVLALCWLADRRAAKYTLSHKSMVEATVCDMVKPDHLKKACE